MYGIAIAITNGIAIEMTPVMTAGTKIAGLLRRSASSLPSSAATLLTRLPFEQSQVHLFERRLVGHHRYDVRSSLDQHAHDSGRHALHIVDSNRQRPVIDADIRECRPKEVGKTCRCIAKPDKHSRAEQFRAERSRSVERHEARTQYGDAIRHALYFVQIVRRNQNRPPFAAQTQDQVANIAGALRVEPGRRLVEQHDLRLVQQRARQRDPLLQSLRELRGAIVLPIGDIEEIERFIDGARRVRDAMQPRIDEKVRSDRQTVPQARRFREETNVTAKACSCVPRHRFAVDADAAAGRVDQPGEHAQRGGLAGAVGTEQREDFARRQLKRNIVYGHARIEAAREVRRD